jgi:hypothetical protein
VSINAARWFAQERKRAAELFKSQVGKEFESEVGKVRR